jgi:hypothetical protein
LCLVHLSWERREMEFHWQGQDIGCQVAVLWPRREDGLEEDASKVEGANSGGQSETEGEHGDQESQVGVMSRKQMLCLILPQYDQEVPVLDWVSSDWDTPAHRRWISWGVPMEHTSKGMKETGLGSKDCWTMPQLILGGLGNCGTPRGFPSLGKDANACILHYPGKTVPEGRLAGSCQQPTFW